MSNFVLFEISWETCNKVGGIHTVLSTKAKTQVDRLGDDYIAIGPWLLADEGHAPAFDDEAGHDAFIESCRAMGLPVRVGRWRIPGRPRTILIEFSRLYDHKDDILAGLWEDFEVDSLSGGWDYVEPVLFGHAAGKVIERWWDEHLAAEHRQVVVQAHEWMTAAALLQVKKHVPTAGTVFTTHATMLGRALSSLGHSPRDGLGDTTPAELAREHNVVAKHSLEGVAAREADVFTTVSSVTADEAELLHLRRADPLLPNGIDLSVMDELADAGERSEVRARLVDFATRFLGEDASDATMVGVSGRYEFHNKGIDILLDSLAQMNERDGKPIVLWVLVPAGNSGLRSEVRDRLEGDAPADGPVGITTHNLFDEEGDPVHQHCAARGLDNQPGHRVKVIQVPIYLRPGDGLWDLPYESVLRALDLTAFPSYYEPWGYTPQESLAVGVPTLTTDYAGFGRWAESEKLGSADGVTVLERVGVEYAVATETLGGALEKLTVDPAADADTCRSTAARTAWSDLGDNYVTAWEKAAEAGHERRRSGVPQVRRPRRQVAVASTQAEPQLTRFEVAAKLPESLRGLQRLARNYWWCWDPEATALFASLSPRKWQECGRSPVLFLQQVFAADLEARADDKEFLARLDRVLSRFDAYVGEGTEDIDVGDGHLLNSDHPVAYFSAEFAIHESMPIYSGGLGVLAGDHLKSASDIRLPLVAVGLFYRMGYMGQRLTATGEQMAEDRVNDPRFLPMEAVCSADGTPLEFGISMPGRTLYVRAWWVRVGRVPLYLLDTDTPSNSAEDRDITRNLYGGDHETRILQEIVLGRGGVRLLREMGWRPSVWHMNEGHAAFSTLERVARLVREEGLTFAAAQDYVRATTLFTTHTPVPAGHDRFSEDLMRRYFSDEEEWVGVPWEKFYALGKDTEGSFNMTWLAMNFAAWVNGVSKLHGIASRKLLKAYWPGLLETEVPVNTVTNGIHLSSWTHPAVRRALGAGERVLAPKDFAAADKLDRGTFWDTRRELKRQLIDMASTSLERAFVSRNDSPMLLSRMQEGLIEDALYVGFARRFAPYKRAHLLFEDIERLQALLNHSERPLRILVAGKAHPRDQRGKDILQGIAEKARDQFCGKIFFLEDYDMNLARALVSGVDVWLNNPTRMMEASGTSGMKAAANGVLNLSIGDGWWPEAADGQNGWLIAGDRLYGEQHLQDQFDAAALYRLLEDELLPLYFDRDEDGVPREWMERVVHCLETVPGVFNTDRMVQEYQSSAYEPLSRSYFECNAEKKALPKERSRQNQRIRKGFGDVRVVAAQRADLAGLAMGDSFDVSVQVDLGTLQPSDVVVELVVAHSRGDELVEPRAQRLEPSGSEGSVHTYEGSIEIVRSGSYAGGIRIRSVDEAARDLALWV